MTKQNVSKLNQHQRAPKRVVACVKAEAVEGLSENFDTKECQKDIYRIPAARDQGMTNIRFAKNSTWSLWRNDMWKGRRGG